MVNETLIMEGNYNLTKLISFDVIGNPTQWLANYNSEMSSYAIFTILLLIGLILFFTIRTRPESTDAEALLYSSIICAISGLFLFLVDVSVDIGVKLITWEQLVVFMVIAFVAIIVKYANTSQVES